MRQSPQSKIRKTRKIKRRDFRDKGGNTLESGQNGPWPLAITLIMP